MCVYVSAGVRVSVRVSVRVCCGVHSFQIKVRR